MTNRWIADTAGVSKGTVDRILAGGAKAPRYDTLRDISAALDCDMAEFEGIYVCPPEAAEGASASPRPGDAAYEDDRYFAMMCVYQDQIAEMNARHDQEVARLHRWLSVVVVICLSLIAILVGVLLIDLFNPSVGWIRSSQPARTAHRLAEGIRTWGMM